MKITDVKATLHRIPVDMPLLKEKIWTPIVFVTVETDQGITGYGLTRAAQRFGAKEFINREAAPFLRGKNPVETERIWHQLYTTFNPRAQTGMWSSAVSAIDIALWDIKGKYYKESVWRLLGGAQNPVPAYVTFGLKQYTKEQLVEVAKSFVAQGAHRLKMVVAVDPENPNVDAERVQAVREAVGEKVELMIDANYLFSFNRALELCKLVEPYRITWFEEPVYQNDAHRFRHRELIVNHAVDIVQPNVCSVGGYTEAVKVAAMAQAFNLPIANGGGWPHHNMHLHAAMANGWRVEFHVDMWKVGEAIYQNPPPPKDDWVTLAETPGLGLEPRLDALKEYEEK